MLELGGVRDKVPGADTITLRIHGRINIMEENTQALLDATCSTIYITLDGWISNNDIPFMAIDFT